MIFEAHENLLASHLTLPLGKGAPAAPYLVGDGLPAGTSWGGTRATILTFRVRPRDADHIRYGPDSVHRSLFLIPQKPCARTCNGSAMPGLSARPAGTETRFMGT